MLQKGIFEENMNAQSFETTIVPILGLPLKTPTWGSKGKVPFGCSPHGVTKYSTGRGVVLPPKGCGPCKACV